MVTRKYKRTYIKEWRLKRGLSLRKLAARIEVRPGEDLISFSSLGRIEKGQQPYSQPIIEGVAEALGVTVPMLLEINPDADGEIIDLLRHMDADRRAESLKILKAIAS
jgi:transcriptional regulator with XRE-family HTH domain